MISYKRYNMLIESLLTGNGKNFSQKDYDDLDEFEASQPNLCPKCGRGVKFGDRIGPKRVVHDVSSCIDPIIKGWLEEYKCGCVSDAVEKKKDLLGYCKTHGEPRKHIHPDISL